jgi:HEPN domain-containing protein
MIRVMAQMDRTRHVAYWRDSAEQDLSAARDLIDRGHVRHALFFLHLAAEKTLKGLIVHKTGQMPPKSHDLLRLAELASVELPDERAKLLSRMARYCLEGRYPDTWLEPPTLAVGRTLLVRGTEMIEWFARLF